MLLVLSLPPQYRLRLVSAECTQRTAVRAMWDPCPIRATTERRTSTKRAACLWWCGGALVLFFFIIALDSGSMKAPKP